MYVPLSTGTFARYYLEPISTQEATERTIDILDTDYSTRKQTYQRFPRTLVDIYSQ